MMHRGLFVAVSELNSQRHVASTRLGRELARRDEQGLRGHRRALAAAPVVARRRDTPGGSGRHGGGGALRRSVRSWRLCWLLLLFARHRSEQQPLEQPRERVVPPVAEVAVAPDATMMMVMQRGRRAVRRQPLRGQNKNRAAWRLLRAVTAEPRRADRRPSEP